MTQTETDVVVVGAGPVGMTAALALAQAGRSVTVVDRQAQGQNTSRAAVVHARTLEVLQELGMAQELIAAGLPLTTFIFRTHDRILVQLDFSGLATAFPMVLFLSQAETERHLRHRLEAMGVPLRRPVAVVGLEQDDDGVDVLLQDGDRIRARYVVGADGMHSTVRELCGIPFADQGRGGSADDASFVLADVALADAGVITAASLNISPEGLLVFVPLPGGNCRLVAEVREAPEILGEDYLRTLLETRGPSDQPSAIDSVAWASRFRIHHKLAASFRHGRVLLAGDAAHVHSPAGGQGMNLGIRDAVAVAKALDAVLAGADSGLLDGVAEGRRKQAQDVIALTQRLSRIAVLPRGLRGARNTALRMLGRIAPVRRSIAGSLAGLGDRGQVRG